jgi:radical SAM protein with 4Fe4S-binding SPASM domain
MIRGAFRNLLDPAGNYRHEPGDPRLRLRMDITNKCNLLCKMCFYPGTVSEPKYDMEPALFRKIVEQVFPHTETATLSCQFEPFMSRHIEEVLDIAAGGACRRIGFVTNATLWSERRIRQLVDNPAVETLAISIDGGTKETYERIRVNANWDKVVRNIEMLAALKRERGTDRPAVQFNMVLMKATARELPQLVDLARRADAVLVEAIRYLEIAPGLDEGIGDWEEVMPALIEAKHLAHESGIRLFLPIADPRLDVERDTVPEATCNEAPVGRFSSYCEAPWSAVQIFPNGDVHPCGYYEKSFGNLHEQDFQDIWNSRPYLELRRSLARMALHAKCAACNPHGYDNVERKGKINR